MDIINPFIKNMSNEVDKVELKKKLLEEAKLIRVRKMEG